jgi:hypothetical protein
MGTRGATTFLGFFPAASAHLHSCHTLPLQGLEEAQALAEFREIDLVPVELGAVHAGELGAAAHADAAGAAHADAVDHDGVQGHGGLDAEGLGGPRHGGHHGHRAHGHDLADALVLLQALLQKLRDQALVAVAAVVRGHEDLVGEELELILEEQQVLVAGADDGHDLVAGLVVPLGDVMHGRDARAAAHADDRTHLVDFCSLAQGAAQVQDVVSLLQLFEHGRGLAEDEVDDGDGALVPVGVGDGQGDAFALGVHAQDDEVPRLRLGRDVRRMDDELGGLVRDKLFLFKNGIRHVLFLSVAVLGSGLEERRPAAASSPGLDIACA